MEVLRRRFGIDGIVLRCIAEFLSDQNHTVRVDSREPGDTMLQSGVPLGSVLGPRLYIEYAEGGRLTHL